MTFRHWSWQSQPSWKPLLLVQAIAHLMRAAGVDGVATSDDLADHPLLVDNKRHALGPAQDGHEDAVSAGDGLVFVAEDGEGDAERLGELPVLLAAVHADAEHLRARRFEPGDISLIRLELARSAGRPGLEIECQHHGLLAAKIAQPDRVPILIG